MPVYSVEPKVCARRGGGGGGRGVEVKWGGEGTFVCLSSVYGICVLRPGGVRYGRDLK